MRIANRNVSPQNGHAPRQRPGLHHTRDTLWQMAAHELHTVMGSYGEGKFDPKDRVAVFELKTVTVDSDQRASLSEPMRVFADDHDRMAQLVGQLHGPQH